MTEGTGPNVDTGAVAIPAVTTATVLLMVLLGFGCVLVCRERKGKRRIAEGAEDGGLSQGVHHRSGVSNGLYTNVICSGKYAFCTTACSCGVYS